VGLSGPATLRKSAVIIKHKAWITFAACPPSSILQEFRAVVIFKFAALLVTELKQVLLTKRLQTRGPRRPTAGRVHYSSSLKK
jgi:hypothetical protein